MPKQGATNRKCYSADRYELFIQFTIPIPSATRFAP
jgi:hypothetical protein